MLTYWRPRIKDQGSMLQRFTSGNLGTITANATATFGLGALADTADTGGVPGHTGYVDEIIVSCVTVPVDADGTYLLNVYKYDASATAAVTLVTGYSMEALVAGKAKRVPFDTLTDQQRIIDFGDSLYFTLVSNSAAIDTQMVGGTVSVLVKLLS